MEELLCDDVNEQTPTENMEQNREKLEDKEFKEINSILPSLLKENLFTNIDCRIIASEIRLSEKQGAVYRVIMSKTKEEAAKLTEIFRTLSLKVHVNEDSNQLTSPDFDEQETDAMSLLKTNRNPFLNNMIIKCLFGFLPLNNLKNARFICQQWNSSAEIWLRKRSAIRFNSVTLTPETFIEVSKYSFPGLPFPAFIFSSSEWFVSEIQIFFEKWGKHIKEIVFDNITLLAGKDPLDSYDVTPWLEMAPNTCSLQIRCRKLIPNGEDDFIPISGSSLDISLERLFLAKTVVLDHCYILTRVKNKNTLIAPVKIKLFNVGVKQDGTILPQFRVNDFFDFASAVDVHVANGDFFLDRPVVFDMKNCILNIVTLRLMWVKVENWADAKGEIHSLYLGASNFEQKNQIKINQLRCHATDIDLSALPQTLEKLEFAPEMQFNCSEPIQLPILNFLSLDTQGNNTSQLSHFSNCANLVELKLVDYSRELWSFHLNCVPRSVKKLMLNGFQFQFEEDVMDFDLDLLILKDQDGNSNLADCLNVLRKIKPKVLVIVYSENMELDTSDIMRIVYTQTQIETIMFGSDYEQIDIHEQSAFEGSSLSYCVDKKSNNYRFDNQIGIAITCKEFKSWSQLNGWIES